MRCGPLAAFAPFALIWVAALGSGAAEPRASLVPERAPAFRASRVFESLRSGSRAPRALRIEVIPGGAQLELAYLRDGVQLARVAGAAPLDVDVPGRALIGKSDRVVLRAELDGYAPAELTLDARELGWRVRVELARLPRSLLDVSLLELGRYARLELFADGALEARLAPTADGWRLVLAEVAFTPNAAAALASLAGGAIARAELRVVGVDSILELATSEPREPPRLLRRDEALRPRGQLALEWLPEDASAAPTDDARRALASLTSEAFDPCGAAFERELTSALGQDTIARSLASKGTLSEALLIAALKRLAALAPDGALALRDGSRIFVDTPLGERAALLRASEVRGALVALRTLTAALAPQGAAARSQRAWLAPERPQREFAAILARAAQAEARCRS
jgi:hypothetical protein